MEKSVQLVVLIGEGKSAAVVPPEGELEVSGFNQVYYRLRVSDGLKLILQIFVMMYHIGGVEDDRLNMSCFGVFAVGLYFEISGYLSALSAPIGGGAPIGGPPVGGRSLKLVLMLWLKWLVRRFVPLTIMLYLLHPFYVFMQPAEEGVPDTLDMVTWSWFYWWYSDIRRSYNSNTTLWFISVLLLYYLMTPILVSVLWRLERKLILIGLLLLSVSACPVVLYMAPTWNSHLQRQTIYCSPISHFPLYTTGLVAGLLKRRSQSTVQQTTSIKILIDIAFIMSVLSLGLLHRYLPDRPNGLANQEHIGALPFIAFIYLATETTCSDHSKSSSSSESIELASSMFPLSCKVLESRYLRRLTGGRNDNESGSIPLMSYLIHWTLIPFMIGIVRPMGTVHFTINNLWIVFIVSTILSLCIFQPIQQLIRKLTH